MKKKQLNYSILIIIFFFVSTFISCSNKKSKEGEEDEIEKNSANANTPAQPKENPYSNAEIEIKVFKNDTVSGIQLHGFGYDVYLNNKLYVHQPNIPSVSGNTGFNTEEQASTTGEYIAYKIKHNIMPPSVTPHELDSLGVLK